MTTSISDRNQEQQAFERSQVLLAKNLSAVSLAENQLFSVLDGGSDSFVMRNHLVTVLHSYLNSMN